MNEQQNATSSSQEGSSNNSQEDNIKDLSGPAAMQRIRETAEKAETCFFCTSIKTGIPMSVRPMSCLQVDDNGDLWFMSLKESTKNEEIIRDPFTHLLFQVNNHSGFMNLYGISEITKDQAKIDELWSPILETWFQGGKDDPHISLIKFTPTEGYYWDNKHGNVVAFLKMAASVVTGKTMDDSIEGTLEV